MDNALYHSNSQRYIKMYSEKLTSHPSSQHPNFPSPQNNQSYVSFDFSRDILCMYKQIQIYT